jgi:hypothetical protein
MSPFSVVSLSNVWGFAQAGELRTLAAALHKDILFIIQRGQQQPGLRKATM